MYTSSYFKVLSQLLLFTSLSRKTYQQPLSANSSPSRLRDLVACSACSCRSYYSYIAFLVSLGVLLISRVFVHNALLVSISSLSFYVGGSTFYHSGHNIYQGLSTTLLLGICFPYPCLRNVVLKKKLLSLKSLSQAIRFKRMLPRRDI